MLPDVLAAVGALVGSVPVVLAVALVVRVDPADPQSVYSQMGSVLKSFVARLALKRSFAADFSPVCVFFWSFETLWSLSPCRDGLKVAHQGENNLVNSGSNPIST